MTKKQFRYDMQRGLGSCVVALKNMQDTEKEKFRPLVVWGCCRDMAYDAQCEGSRSWYLYELITQFPDEEPFVFIIGKRLFQCMRSAGWEFSQDCDLLSCFVSDGNRRAWKILTECYDALFQILLKKRRRTKYGLLPERDNFEALCISLVSMCFDDRRTRMKLYEKTVRNLGILIEKNSLYGADDFDWFQTVSEDCLGKKTVHRLLYHANADEHIKTYACSMEIYQATRESEWGKHRRAEPEAAEEVCRRLKAGEKVGQMCTPLLAQKWMNHDREQEVWKLAAYYKDEKEPDVRHGLLWLLANKACAGTLDLTQLFEDSKSAHSDLSKWAFEALGCRKDERVRAYALELLQDGTHTASAVSMLAKNYEAGDRNIFVNAVKRIPITYKDGEWHGTFHDVRDLFYVSGKDRPTELLPYMYRNTLCSFCREYVVKEMGRRRMLTRELLEEMQYDCNREIRVYAERKLSGIRV